MKQPNWKPVQPSWIVLCNKDNKFIDLLNGGYVDRLIKVINDHRSNNEAFKKDLEMWLFRHYHGRAQFEFSMVGARAYHVSAKDVDRIRNGATDAEPGLYVDVYAQVMANFDVFADYVWRNRKAVIYYNEVIDEE